MAMEDGDASLKLSCLAVEVARHELLAEPLDAVHLCLDAPATMVVAPAPPEGPAEPLDGAQGFGPRARAGTVLLPGPRVPTGRDQAVRAGEPGGPGAAAAAGRPAAAARARRGLPRPGGASPAPGARPPHRRRPRRAAVPARRRGGAGARGGRPAQRARQARGRRAARGRGSGRRLRAPDLAVLLRAHREGGGRGPGRPGHAVGPHHARARPRGGRGPAAHSCWRARTPRSPPGEFQPGRDGGRGQDRGGHALNPGWRSPRRGCAPARPCARGARPTARDRPRAERA